MSTYTVTLSTRGFAVNVTVEAANERDAKRQAVTDANGSALDRWDGCTGPGAIGSITFRPVKWTLRHVAEVYQHGPALAETASP